MKSEAVSLLVDCLLGSSFVFLIVVHEPFRSARDAFSKPRYLVQAVIVVVPEGWKSSQASGDKELAGYKEWGHRDTREPTTTDTGGARTSICQDSGGKMHRSQACDGAGGRFLNVNSEDLGKLQKILHSKKGSLGRTYKANTEVNANSTRRQ